MITSPQSSQYISDILMVVNMKIMVLSLFQHKDEKSRLLLNVGTIISNCRAAHLRVCTPSEIKYPMHITRFNFKQSDVQNFNFVFKYLNITLSATHRRSAIFISFNMRKIHF